MPKTIKEKIIKRLFDNSGATFERIAMDLQCSASWVAAIASDLGVKPRKRSTGLERFERNVKK